MRVAHFTSAKHEIPYGRDPGRALEALSWAYGASFVPIGNEASCPKIKWFCRNITRFFFFWGGGGAKVVKVKYYWRGLQPLYNPPYIPPASYACVLFQATYEPYFEPF